VFGVADPRRRSLMAVALPRRVDPVVDDAAVQFWLARLPDSRLIYLGQMRRFLAWLGRQEGWMDSTAGSLIAWQDKVQTKDERYAILNLLETYVNTLPAKAYKSRQLTYTAIRSFFAHNRSELPSDPNFRVRGEKPPTRGRLTEGDVRRIVSAAKLRDRSAILVKWMGLLDNKTLEYTGTVLADEVVSQMKASNDPVRLDMPGRKRQENERPYFTFIGKDAVDALAEYFEKERKGGWPRKGEPLWYDQYGLPLSRTGFAECFMALSRRVALVPKEKRDVSARYGYNSHEMRDAARTLLHVKAKAENFDLDVAEFMMGHTSKLDPLKYDKFYLEQEYMTAQYRIAEKHLNIISASAAEQEKTKEMESLREEVKQLRGQFETILKTKLAPDQ